MLGGVLGVLEEENIFESIVFDFFIQNCHPSYKNSKIVLRNDFVNFYMKYSYSNKEQVLIAVDLNLSEI